MQEKQGLPLIVGIEMGKHSFHEADQDYMPAVVICNKRSNFQYENKRDYLCLTADNRWCHTESYLIFLKAYKKSNAG